MGARADLVATGGDPLHDITGTERVSFVMKEGAVMKGREVTSRPGEAGSW